MWLAHANAEQVTRPLYLFLSMRRLRSALAALALLGAATDPLSGQWDFPFSDVQTFTAPTSDTYLQAIYYDAFMSRDVDLRFEIFTWTGSPPRFTGSPPSGPALFSLTLRGAALDGIALQPQLNLDPGVEYGFFWTMIYTGPEYNVSMGLDPLNPIPGGALYTCYSGLRECQYARDENTDARGFRTEFTAPPTTVPEPASLALLASGLAGVAAVRRRRKLQVEKE